MTASRTHRHVRIGVLSLAIAQALAVAPVVAQTYPSGFGGNSNVTAPVVTGTTGNETVTVNVTGPRAYAEWNTFNLSNGQTFNVTNTSTPNAYIFVNRVIGNTASLIDGRVQANGNIWLINPNGITVGSTGVFDVGGLMLSTATLLNGEDESTNGAAFLAGTSPVFSLGGAAGGITVQPGAQLIADIGTIALLANQVNLSGNINAGSGEIAAVGAQALTVGFDADLNAFTTLAMDAGSNQTVGAQINGGDFTAARTVIAAAGMTNGQGNVLLANTGAAFLTFIGGNIELTSRDGNVVSERQISAPGDLTVTAGNVIDIGGAGGIYVQGDYSLTADDFYGGTFSATLLGTNSAFSITDTRGGIAVGALTAPGDFTITATNGGSVNIASWNGNPLASTNGNVRIATVGGGDIQLTANVITGTTAGRTITIDSSGRIDQTGGALTTHGLVATAQAGAWLPNLNQLSTASLSAASGDVRVNSSVAGYSLTQATTGWGSVTIDGANGVTLSDATVRSDNGSVTINPAVRLVGNNVVRSQGGGVTFAGTVDAATVGVGQLGIASTTGTTFGADVGATSALGSLSVTGSALAHGSAIRASNGIALGALHVASPAGGVFNMDAGTGSLTSGAITTGYLGAFNAYGRSVGVTSYNGPDASLWLEARNGDVSLGSGDIGGSATLRATGNVLMPGLVQAAGTVNMTGQNLQLGTVRSTGGSVRLEGAGGQLHAGTVEAYQGIEVIATALGDVGQANTSGDLSMTVAGGPLRLGSGRGNVVNLIADGGGSVEVAGSLVASRLTAVAAGGLTMLGNNQIAELGNINSVGVRINNVGALRVAGTVEGYGNDVTLSTSGGDLEIASTGQVSGSVVALSTDANFVNLSGSDAVLASSNWAIYSAAPAGNSFGGLDSGNTALWNGTLGTRTPGSLGGNRYVFALQPTLTFTSTSVGKTYGTDHASSAGGLFTVSGLQAGVAGAFLGDTLASAYSGAPLVSSTGFDARASVAGGPYAITLSNGSLASGSGYGFAFANTGLVTVDPLGVTGTVNVDNRTYDGTTNGTGTVTLNGVLAGDNVVTAGTSFVFVDKNAGNGKTVNVSGTTLTGADAGNYTLSVPSSVLADIFRKAITASVVVDNKTYDGNRTGTGTVMLDGVVTGDAVGTSGTTYTFDTKNAGTGKTVTVSGTTLTGGDAGNYSLSVPASALADILRKALTATVVVDNKTYDGTTNAAGTITLGGTVAGDDVCTCGTVFAFETKDAGAGKVVTITGTSLAGADAGNYTLSVPATAVADILRKAITGSVLVDDKTYDGTRSATGAVTLNGVVSGDTVDASGTTFTFSDKNAGAGKTVTVSGTVLTGTDAGNYTLTVPASALADILRKAINAAVVVDTKTYDGATNATGTVTLGGVVAGDTVGTGGSVLAFGDRNAGSGKTVTVSGTTLTGADAGNYSLDAPTGAVGEILRKAIGGAVVVDSKTYDGTTNATGTITLTGLVAGDRVDATGTLIFADRNAGAGKTVSVSGATLTGTDAGNYTLTVPTSVIGEILRKAITGTAQIDNRTYDGTTTASGRITLDGVVAGDHVGASGAFTFADGNAGTGKSVNVSSVALTGADAGNYTVTLDGATLADILQRAITVNADPHSKTSGSEDPALTWTITDGSLVSGDLLTGALTRAPGEAVGTYAITQGTLDATANYRLTFVGSTLTITEVPRTPIVPRPGRDTATDVLDRLSDRIPAHARARERLDVVDDRSECGDGAKESGACGSTQPR